MDKFHIAIQQMADDYLGGTRAGGGVPALAKSINVREGTLYNKVNPTMDGHTLNVDEFRAALLQTKDFRPLDELERDCGRIAYKLPDFSKIGDVALLEAYSKIHKEAGDVAANLSQALADGDITIVEAAQIEKEVLEQVAAMMEFLERVKAIAK